MTRRQAQALAVSGIVAALALTAGVSAIAQADTPEEKFVADIEKSNAVATNIPGTSDRWLAAGWASCDRITRTSSQGLPIRAAINNEVIAAATFNVIPRQDAVALVTYAVLDLCPQLIPQRGGPPPPPSDPPPGDAPPGDPPPSS